MAAIVAFRDSENHGSSPDPGIKTPANVAASTAAAPITDASTVFPGRNLDMYQPTNSAIGIVQAIVNVPQELPGTSRLASFGRTQPPAFASPFRGASAGA